MMHQGTRRQRKAGRLVKTGAAVIAAAVIATGVIIFNKSADPTGPLPVDLPPASGSYLGVFTKGLPTSYTGVTAFTRDIGAKPDVLMYYSGWFVPFPVGFATTAANNGAVPLVQMDPDNISIAAIASGRYDAYGSRVLRWPGLRRNRRRRCSLSWPRVCVECD